MANKTDKHAKKRTPTSKQTPSSWVAITLGKLQKILQDDLQTLFSTYTPYRFRMPDYLFAALSGLLCLVIYTATLTPSISSGDNGELTVAAHFLGVAHAPSYPIHSLLGKLFTFLPIGNIAWRVNFFSAFAAATFVFLSCLVFVKAMFMLNFAGFISRFSALAASLSLGLSPALWSQATIAEVYTVSAIFFPALLLWLLAWHGELSTKAMQYGQLKDTANPQAPSFATGQHLPYRDIYGERYLLALGLLFGLSLGGHHTILMTEIFLGFFIIITLLSFVIIPYGLKKAVKESLPLVGVVLGLGLAWGAYYVDIMSLSSNFFANDYQRLRWGLGIFLGVHLLFALHWIYYGAIKKKPLNLMESLSLSLIRTFLFLYVGFSIYFYVFIRSHASPPINWGGISEETELFGKLAKFFFIIHRKQFAANELSLGSHTMLMLFSHMINPIHFKQFTLFSWAAGLLGIFGLLRRNPYLFLITLFGFATYSIQLTLFLRFALNERSFVTAEIFFIFSYLVLSIPMAVGWGLILTQLENLTNFLIKSKNDKSQNNLQGNTPA